MIGQADKVHGRQGRASSLAQGLASLRALGLLPFAIALSILLLGISTARHIHVRYIENLETQHRRLESTATLFSERLTAILRGPETTLAFYAASHIAHPDMMPPGFGEDIPLWLEGFDGFMLLDASCTTIATPTRPFPDAVRLKTMHLCRTLLNDKDSPALIRPDAEATEGRLILARRLVNADGVFDGIITAIMTPGHMRSPLATGGGPPVKTVADVLSLVDIDDTPLATWQRAGGPEVQGVLPARVSRQGTSGPGPSRQPLITHRHDIPGYPLRIVVGVTTDRALAEWREQSLRQGLAAAAISFAIAALGLLALRQKRRRLVTERALAESERRYRVLVENFPESAVMLFSDDKRCMLADGAGLAAMGITANSAIGRSPQELLPAHAAPPLAEAIDNALAGDVWRGSFILGERLIELHVSPMPPLTEEESSYCLAVLRDATEAERIRRELRDSAYRLNEAQRIARLGSFEANFVTGDCVWSHELLRLVGLSPDDAPASLESFFERFAPEQRAWLETLLHGPMQGPLAVIEHSFPFRTADDRNRHGRLHLHFHRGESGMPAIGYGTMQDITELHEATIALKRSEADLNEALHIAQMASITHEHGTGTTRISSTLLHLLHAEGTGRPTVELLRQYMPSLLPLVRDGVAPPQRHQPPAGDGYRTVIPFTTVSGEQRHGQLHLRTLRDVSGNAVVTRGAIQDVTYRVSIENALRRSESSYRALADNLPNGVVLLVDPADILRVAAGQGLHSLLDSGAPCIPAPYTTILPSPLATELMPLIMSARHGTTAHREIPYGAAVFDVVALPLPGETHRTEGVAHDVMLLLQDVTSRKQWEEQMRASRDEAAAMSELKSQFVANISHEMRTPLSGILGIADVALTTEGNPALLRNYFSMVQNVAEGLLGVINDLLDFSRLEAGRMPLDKVEYDLHTTVRDALAPLAMQAERKGLALELHMQNGLPLTLRGDPLRLRQILVNLVGNAVKFTPQGTVHVDVSTGDGVTHDRECLVFTIEDTGPGIPHEKLAHIFESFAQADGSYSRQHTGSGLGLAISRHLVELQGGDIGVQSTPGKGSVFWFTLPLGDIHPARRTQRQRVDLDTRTPTTPLRILLAEDNELNREFLTIFLEEGGHSVVTACDGYEVLDILHREHVDLVLMDIQMPRMNGMEATRSIRSSGEAWSTVPVIALTAHSMAGDRDRFIAEGMSDFVGKPVDRNELHAAIARNTRHMADK